MRARHVAAVLLSLLAACEARDALRERFRGVTPHERYADALRQTGLDSSALGRDWLAAAEGALRAAVDVPLPFQEASYFAASEARAAAYRVRLRDGQQLVVSVAAQGGAPARVFVDLFRAPSDTARPPYHVASADSATGRIATEARGDGTFLVRVQPELLRSVRLMVTMRTEPSLAFPVAGRGNGAIQSFWGAERDAGARSHKGIDIFAPRGTPVLAATDGYVRSIEPNRLGGNVVWLSDAERGQSLYYAHLDRHAVRAGDQVSRGDTVGFVGNSGNARTTAPHLHFGIYRRGEGAVNPLYHVYRVAQTIAPLRADTGALGRVRRVATQSAPLLAAPSASATQVATLPPATAVLVEGAAGSWYRVRLPDQRAGYVAAVATADPARPVRIARLPASTAVRDTPRADAATITTITTSAAVPILATFDRFALVRFDSVRVGWVAMEGGQ